MGRWRRRGPRTVVVRGGGGGGGARRGRGMWGIIFAFLVLVALGIIIYMLVK